MKSSKNFRVAAICFIVAGIIDYALAIVNTFCYSGTDSRTFFVMGAAMLVLGSGCVSQYKKAVKGGEEKYHPQQTADTAPSDPLLHEKNTYLLNGERIDL